MKIIHDGGDTAIYEIECSSAAHALRSMIASLPQAINGIESKDYDSVAFHFRFGDFVADEQALGCLLRLSKEDVLADLAILADIIINYNQKHPLELYRNEMVPIGLDVIFNFVISKYQHYQDRHEGAYRILVNVIKSLDWDHIGYQHLWLEHPVLIKDYGFDNSEWKYILT